MAGGNPLNDAMAVFSKQVAERSRGRIKVDVHIANALAKGETSCTTARWWWRPPASVSSCRPSGTGFFIACGIAILVPWVTLVLPRMLGLG